MSFPAQVLRTIPAPVRELGSGPPFSEGGGPAAPSSGGGEPDWRSLFERERRRAEEWRRGEIDWRAKARFWRRQFEIGRDKLAAARAEAREVRRAARLFANTPYGTSVWARFLYERHACLRPLNRVADWLTGQGLAISAGTLADGARRLAPLFEPLSAAILAHQREARLRQGDETSWRIQALGEAGGSSRAWLWIGVCGDAVCFHVDPSRSAAAAAARLFGDAAPGTVLVCDRYSAYKKLAKDSAGLVTLAFCWAYVAARIMLRRAGIAALDMKILVLSAT